jgi:hypothetical protein
MNGRLRQLWASRWFRTVVLLALVALRLPAVVEPAGNDQNLYMYVADRVLDGGAPYVEAWDQKPPGVFFVYAAVRAFWPHGSAVAVADVVAAALTAVLLLVVGRRAIGGHFAFAAASVFLLFSHPSIQRISGVYVRGQCEVFLAASVAAAIVLTWRDQIGRGRLVVAGVALGLAVWLKYNAITYTLPVAIAILCPPAGQPPRRIKDLLAAVPWIAGGAGIVSLFFIGFLAAHGALADWWLATITYNLAYSGETYTDRSHGPLGYLLTMPIDRTRADLLWFLGAVGGLLVVLGGYRHQRAAGFVAAAWTIAAIGSIALNGARDLPQYFIQAYAPLAFLFATGLATLRGRAAVFHWAVAGVLALGLWRVGTDEGTFAGLRWGGLPEMTWNVRFDLAYLNGHIDRRTYLARFKGTQKYDALESDTLASLARRTTRPDDRVYVFGFAPAVYLDSGRLSPSRFFWSRPVVIEFASDHASYGSAGVLRDLTAAPPAIVALQKQDWAPGDPNSMTFFLDTPRLGNWLLANYVVEQDTPFFQVWRRRTQQ